MIQNIIQDIYKKFYVYKKKPGGRIKFKILCHENLNFFFVRPKNKKLILHLKEIKKGDLLEVNLIVIMLNS